MSILDFIQENSYHMFTLPAYYGKAVDGGKLNLNIFWLSSDEHAIINKATGKFNFYKVKFINIKDYSKRFEDDQSVNEMMETVYLADLPEKHARCESAKVYIKNS
jgi:hypothetical protein